MEPDRHTAQLDACCSVFFPSLGQPSTAIPGGTSPCPVHTTGWFRITPYSLEYLMFSFPKIRRNMSVLGRRVVLNRGTPRHLESFTESKSGAGAVAEVAECLCSMHEALGYAKHRGGTPL